MKITEKNNKVIEPKPNKENTFSYSLKSRAVTEEEKRLLMVYYSFLKNIS